MATKNEVRDRAAEDLGIKRIGQGMQNQDQVRIEAGYDEVFQRLKNRGLATWSSTGEVPTEIVPYMVALITKNCFTSFPISVERTARIVAVTGLTGELAISEIGSLVTPKHESLEEPTDY